MQLQPSLIPYPIQCSGIDVVSCHIIHLNDEHWGTQSEHRSLPVFLRPPLRDLARICNVPKTDDRCQVLRTPICTHFTESLRFDTKVHFNKEKCVAKQLDASQCHQNIPTSGWESFSSWRFLWYDRVSVGKPFIILKRYWSFSCEDYFVGSGGTFFRRSNLLYALV